MSTFYANLHRKLAYVAYVCKKKRAIFNVYVTQCCKAEAPA